jgi:hypothetical protein
MHRYPRYALLLLILLAALILAACQGATEQGMTVTVIADGTSRVLVVEGEPTVSDVLRRAGITLGDLDRLNPAPYNRVRDGMTITVVRVVEQTVISQETIPFSSRTVPSDGLPAGETRLLQAGANGTAEVTYRITYEDGSEAGRSEVRRVIITPPQEEIVMVGSLGELPTVTINGTLAYISSGNAWVMRQNSANRRPLTTEGGLDGRIFELSGDGRRLLFTRGGDGGITLEAGSAFNSLWAVLDTADPEAQAVPLDLENVLFAVWVPGTERVILYSTGEPRSSYPGWQANNDLWRGQIDAEGRVVQRVQLLEASGGGTYGFFGTGFAFAPDGVTLAWAQPDAVGVLIPNYTPPQQPQEDTAREMPSPEPTPTPLEGDLPPELLPYAYIRQTLASFAPWNAYDFIWRPEVSWSPDGGLIATTTHGAPLGSELAEDSQVFDLSVLPAAGGYSITLIAQTGMWAAPRYSPAAAPDGTPLEVQIAYLQADEPLDSVTSRYRLAVMDRDGSNRRTVYPATDRAGLLPQVYTWSPDGKQIALVDPGPEGNLFIVDISTGLAQQLTLDGLSSSPRWAP